MKRAQEAVDKGKWVTLIKGEDVIQTQDMSVAKQMMSDGEPVVCIISNPGMWVMKND